MDKNKIIAFDADDTLWINETIFTSTREKFKALLSKYTTGKQLEDKLYQTEMWNLSLFGYGIKGFTLSMIETAIELTNERITGRDIHQITAMGKEMLAHPVELLEGVEETLQQLQEEYQLMVITKGDLFDQETKLARSGLADYFNYIEIVSEKNEKTYENILRKYNISMDNFLMIGNSVKSDILPICALGGKAVYIPFHTNWVHELVADEVASAFAYDTINAMPELPALLNKIWETAG